MAGRNGWSISAAVNKWETTAEKLKWLRVRLTGKAQTVFRKLPQDVRENYAECVKALKQRFDPDSRRELYVAELHTRARRKEEDWASYGDVLRTLADKTYGDLEEIARERLALTQFLAHIENPQVAFGVRQKRPETVEAAVLATIELESYLGINSGTGKDSVPSVSAATPVSGPEPLAETLRMLNERLEKLEVLAVSYPSTRTQERLGTRAREQSTGGTNMLELWQERTCGEKMLESAKRKASGKLQPLGGKGGRTYDGPSTYVCINCPYSVCI